MVAIYSEHFFCYEEGWTETVGDCDLLLWYDKLLLYREAAHQPLQLIRKHKSAKENQDV